MSFEPVSGYSTNRTSTVFSDGSNEQRAEFVATLSDGWALESYSTDKSSAVITDGVNKQRAVITYNLNGGTGGGSSSGATTATNVSVNLSGMNIIKTANVQAALKELDLAVKDLQDSVSILATSVELSNEFGQSTVVLLDELTSIEIDGRPSYKEPGATVYAENGSVGIISTLDTANGTANVVTISTFSTSVTSDNGIKGDYSATYGIISMPNGVITSPVDNNNLNIPAGIMLKAAGTSTLTTLASASTHETVSTSNFTLFYVDGEFLECGDVYYSYKEPAENGIENFQAWFNPTIGKWQFRSNDTGNVWREAIATPLCDCIFTNGNITRIDFIGYRVLNKQEFISKDIADELYSEKLGSLVSGDIQLEHNTTYTGDIISNLNISFPSDINSLYISQINFTSGTTATTFIAPDTIKWSGDSIKQNALVPEANKRYSVLFYYDGVNIRAISQGV